MTNRMTKLTLSNYQQLQEKINLINPNFYISALNISLWKNYDLDIYYVAENNAIYLYLKVLKDKLVVEDCAIKNFYILRPIIKQNEISYKYLIKAIDNIKEFIGNQKEIIFDRLFDNDLKYFKNYQLVSSVDSSYLYLTEKFKGFPGKKMQKKRNLLNSFNKTFGVDTKLVKYESSQNEIILEFVKNHIIENHGSLREYEYNYIKDLLNTNEANLTGSLMYYNDKLIGVTVGYTRNDIYEIFLEKADKKFKGSYQYLLSNNLILNNINTKFVDRQDSERQEGLEQSKKSYKPYHIFNTHTIKVNINGTN